VLTIAPNAADAIRSLTDSPELPDDASLRISVAELEDASAALELSLVSAPRAGDEVVQDEGVTVFLDERAAGALDDKVLEARVEGDEVSFGFMDREPGPSTNSSGPSA
jgi:iron-sulfur cluster assembly protein